MNKLNFEDVKSMLDDVMHDMDSEKINVIWITTDGNTTKTQINGDSTTLLTAMVSSQNEDFRNLTILAGKFIEKEKNE